MRMTTVACQWSKPKFDYLEARSMEEACSLLSQHKDKARLIAGGTDLLVAMRRRKINVQYVINTKTIPNFDYIRYDGETLQIGALATLSDIESSPIVRDKFPVIANSARLVGTPQIRNVATIGGNLCNAAPSADMAPSLIGLGAKAKLKYSKGERIVTLEEFFTGPGETVLQIGEVLVEILVPMPSLHTRSIYLKLPARTAIDLAVVGVAVAATLDPKGASIDEAK